MLSSLELTKPPTEQEVLQLRRQQYCQALLSWMQARGIRADQWTNQPNETRVRNEARRYAREMSDLVVAELLSEYPAPK